MNLRKIAKRQMRISCNWAKRFWRDAAEWAKEFGPDGEELRQLLRKRGIRCVNS